MFDCSSVRYLLILIRNCQTRHEAINAWWWDSTFVTLKIEVLVKF